MKYTKQQYDEARADIYALVETLQEDVDKILNLMNELFYGDKSDQNTEDIQDVIKKLEERIRSLEANTYR